MHWKLKALIQRLVARLPSRLSYAAYYRLQRRFGALRKMDPRKSVRAAAEIATALRQHGRQLAGGVVLEIGTGRRLNLPIMMWLMGAKRVITVDLHRYLKQELVAEDLAYYRTNRDDVLRLLGECDYRPDRFEQLIRLASRRQNLSALFEACNIHYLAPANASRLPLEDDSVDFHVSTNVFEHIPPDSLASILQEAARVLSNTGLAVHRIDHSDHFSHSDPSLSPLNFLRYTDRQWSRIAGNRYMYMNRLRVDDFQAIFEQCGHDVLQMTSEPDQEVLQQLASAVLPLDARFAGKSSTALATLSSLFVSCPRYRRPAAATVEAA